MDIKKEFLFYNSDFEKKLDQMPVHFFTRPSLEFKEECIAKHGTTQHDVIHQAMLSQAILIGGEWK